MRRGEQRDLQPLKIVSQLKADPRCGNKSRTPISAFTFKLL